MSQEDSIPCNKEKVEFQDKINLRPASNYNPQFVQPVIVNRFPIPIPWAT